METMDWDFPFFIVSLWLPKHPLGHSSAKTTRGLSSYRSYPRDYRAKIRFGWMLLNNLIILLSFVLRKDLELVAH